MTLSRKDVRNRFHLLLTQELTGVPVDHIKRSRMADPKGLSPLVYVASGSSQRPALTVAGKLSSVVLDIFVLVLLSDQANPDWTAEMAEDLLDSIEAQIPDIIIKYRTATGLWNSVEYDQETVVDRVPVGGFDYIIEDIPLRFKFA